MLLQLWRPEAVVRLTGVVGSVGSLVTLAFFFHQPNAPLSTWESVLLGMAMIFTIGLVVIQVRDLSKVKVFSLSDELGIRDYMYQWIKEGGRVVIFSRDMSWVTDQSMKDMLYTKARRNELSICIPAPKPLFDELKSQGASIYIYPELQHVPQSRFTIANYQRGDARIAIGHRSGNKHLIEEFSAGDHPAFYLGTDLAEIIINFHKLQGRP